MNARIVIASALLVGGVVVAIAGAAPQAALSAGQALDAPEGHVAVRGMVASVASDHASLVLTDGERALTVLVPQGVPASVAEGATMVAEGELIDDPLQGRVLAAHEVLVGCPSKYKA